MKSTAPKGWFKVTSAAHYSDFSVSAIETAIRLGQLRSKKVRISGKRISCRIKREWVDEWIEGSPESVVAQIAHHASEIQRLSAMISGR